MSSLPSHPDPCTRSVTAILLTALAACAAPPSAPDPVPPAPASPRAEAPRVDRRAFRRDETPLVALQESEVSSDMGEADEPELMDPDDELAELADPGGPEFQGYPIEGRIVGGPADVDVDLATSFPRPDSIFGGAVQPGSWFKLKERIYEDIGLQLGLSYQTLVQTATATLSGDDTSWGGWAQLETKWELLDRKGEKTGSLIAAADWRHELGGTRNPIEWGVLDVGSLWPTDGGFFDFDPSVTLLYWEQWLPKNSFVLRLGKQLAVNSFDPFRFKDARTSFSSVPFTAHTSIPAPAFGQGASFKWWPVQGGGLYVLGTLNDMNGNPTDFGLDTFFDEREYFYGLEIGYTWRRSPRDFDQLYVDIFYADEKSTQPAFLPNEAGGGFKVLGSKQMDRWVAFGSYTYNTAEGGGFGLTFAQDTYTAGLAYLDPLGVRGEVALGTVYMTPVNENVRDQYGGELYWKMLVTPDLWFTPGFQFIFDPSFNTDEDFVGIAQMKLRLFL